MQKEHNANIPKVGVISLAHTLNDFYSNFLPQMLPFLVVTLPNFTATKAAVLVSAFSLTSSFTQPFFGYFLDQKGKGWLLSVGTLWMGLMLCLIGTTNSYLLMVLLAALAGIGTALFHPQAAAMINEFGGEHKAGALSVFGAGGNIGFALSPLVLISLFQYFGLRATVVTVVPGIIVAAMLYLISPKSKPSQGAAVDLSQTVDSLKSAAKEIIAIIGVIAFRCLAYGGMLTILPLYFKDKNLSNIAVSYLVTIMLFSGAVGGIIGGLISDRYGRKQVIVISLLITSPLFFAFFFTQGLLSTVFLGLAGGTLLSSYSVTIIAAQEAIPDNKALAAGITMGFSCGVGSLLVIPVGWMADIWGLSTAVFFLCIIPATAGVMGLFLKNRPAAYSQILASGESKVKELYK